MMYYKQNVRYNIYTTTIKDSGLRHSPRYNENNIYTNTMTNKEAIIKYSAVYLAIITYSLYNI